MSLADNLPPDVQPGPRCWYALIALSDEDRATLDGWLTGQVSDRRISAALQAEKHEVTAEQVGRHRRRGCKCR